ncbi:GGDEF domain-containing protein [Cellulomonas endophytica]|uniref:sensor domain-containing diguanylate cyclase n=1 Tax=Cellulomonas endophytica TaxID=2494735 RepID=UPI001013C328|nr:GGDEF domain-containing protein [Cellulomonas endophytica]
MSTEPAALVHPGFPRFADAAGAVLADLQARVGLRLWMVTRQVGGDQVVLAWRESSDGYGIGDGSVLDWGGSLCAAMVAELGPSIAPRVADVPAFAGAPVRRSAAVEAYVGVPLVEPDGGLFGTLCAFDPEPQPDTLREHEDLVRLQARLLSTVLALELDREVLRRRAEQAEQEATTDALTGVGNRRGWDRVLAAEEARCRRYAHPACVVAVDVDRLKAVNDGQGHFAGDTLLRRCAAVLAGAVRATDHVARLGGDEFAVLAVETDEAGGLVEVERLRAALDAAGVAATVGLGSRTSAGTLELAWQAADADLYRRKRARAG